MSFFTDGPGNYYGYSCRQLEQNPELHAEVVERWTDEFGFTVLGEGIDTMNSEIEAMGLVRMKFPENAPGDIKIRLMDGHGRRGSIGFLGRCIREIQSLY